MRINQLYLKRKIKNRRISLDEIVISKRSSKVILKNFSNYMDVDVAVVGAGPSGLAAGYYLAKKGIKTAIYERRLSIGGGMWGGGMMFNRIVVQSEAKPILDEFGIADEGVSEGLFCSRLGRGCVYHVHQTVKAGFRIFNLISVEDVMIREDDRVHRAGAKLECGRNRQITCRSTHHPVQAGNRCHRP